jgi:hypothetical protein
MKTIKYIICYFCEKHHRKVFDTWYLQDSIITGRGKIDIWLLNIIQLFIPDYRRFLKKWHEDNSYIRYTSYWK